jgi:hypothetical protein
MLDPRTQIWLEEVRHKEMLDAAIKHAEIKAILRSRKIQSQATSGASPFGRMRMSVRKGAGALIVRAGIWMQGSPTSVTGPGTSSR